MAGDIKIFVTCHREFSYESPGEKNFENQSTFAKVIIKYEGAYFFWNTVYLLLLLY